MVYYVKYCVNYLCASIYECICVYISVINNKTPIYDIYPKGMIHGALWYGDLIMEPVNGSSQTSSANSPLLVSLNSKSSQADIRGQISDRDY